MVREWRGRRRLSQLDLANEAGVSPKHLSFVENGRSRPSPELLLTLARHLDVPLRETNSLLLAAGYAPRFRHTNLDDPSMAPVRSTLGRLLEHHDPFPGLALDRYWNVVLANRAADLLAALVPPDLAEPPLNLFRASLHPRGLAAYTSNLPVWGGYLVRHLHRLVQTTADPVLAELETEVLGYENIKLLVAGNDYDPAATSPPMLACEMEIAGVGISLLSTLTTFGSPLDITLDELMVELFYPADEATEALLREAAG